MSPIEAQNGFGHLLKTVAHGRMVFITRHNTAQSVVMSVERRHNTQAVLCVCTSDLGRQNA